MTPELAAIGSFLMTSLFWAIIIGRVTHTTDQKDKEQRAIIFDLSQAVKDLEQQAHPQYVLRSDGVDCVVERGRPDLPPRRQATVPPNAVHDFTDIEDLPDWEA